MRWQSATSFVAEEGHRVSSGDGSLAECASWSAVKALAKNNTPGLGGVHLLEPRGSTRLEGLGQSHLQDGNPGQAAAHLQQALTIYQRIGAPPRREYSKPSRTTGWHPPPRSPRQRLPTAKAIS